VKRALGGLAALAALVAGTAAFAHWSAGGAGAGVGASGTMQTVTVAALAGGDAPASALVPGGPAAEVILRLTNPNAVAVQVYSVAANGAITADASHSACTTTGVTFTPPASPISPTVTVPANSTVVVRLAGAASMATTSLSACQGATFRIPVTVTALL
jgi:hypothetical protein